MTSAALTRTDETRTTSGSLNQYLRAVWARLAAGALVAALAAWTLVMIPFVRASVLIEAGGASIGLTVAGVVLAASPFIIWAGARMFARGPNLLNPIWFWLFAIAAGAGANTLALLFLRDSVVSVFVLATIGFSAVWLAHYMARQTPAWLAALLFAGMGLGGEWIINAVLDGSWPFTALDLASIGFFALLIALRAPAFPRIHQELTRPSPKAGVTFGAMHLIALAEARIKRPISTIIKDTRS